MTAHSLLIAFTAFCFLLPGAASPVHAQGLPCPPEQIQRLMPSNCFDSFLFGRAVSVQDNRMAIGRAQDSGGRVTTYILNPLSLEWEQETDLVPPDPQPGDAYGYSVALHYDSGSDRWLLATGATWHNTGENPSGAVYLFYSQNGEWIFDAKLTPETTVAYGRFGASVSWLTVDSRLMLVVGAPGSDGHRLPGTVHIFEESPNNVWEERFVLEAPNGGRANGAFGGSVDACESGGETILAVGEHGYLYQSASGPGKAYFYGFDEGTETWDREADLNALDPEDQNLFGYDVSMAPVLNMPGLTHRAVVGCPNEGDPPAGPGAAYIYHRTVDGEWTLESHVIPPAGDPREAQFGWSVDLDADSTPHVLIGAPGYRQFGISCGSAYIFERDEITGDWSATQALFGREADAYDIVGVSTALGNGASSGIAVVGAHTTQCPGGSQQHAVGAVYSFDLNPGEPGNCPPPVLTLQKVPDCAGGQGGEIEVRWFQATPDRRARMAILFGRRTGNFVIPNGNPCAGTPLGLGSLDLQVAFIGSAGDFGAGRILGTIPRSACGAYLQLVDVSRCKTSNVVRIE